MTYYYKGKEIGNRVEAVKFVMALPLYELYNFVYTYLDRFDKGQLEDLIWASLTNGMWTMRDLIEDALLMMENNWEVQYDMDSLDEGETESLGDLEYENWKEEA